MAEKTIEITRETFVRGNLAAAGDIFSVSEADAAALIAGGKGVVTDKKPAKAKAAKVDVQDKADA